MALTDKIWAHFNGCITDKDGVVHIIDQKMCGDTVFCVAINRENDSVRGYVSGNFDDDTIAVILAVLNDQIDTQLVIRGMVRALALHDLKEAEEKAHE